MSSVHHSRSRSILALLSTALLVLSIVEGLPVVVSGAASPPLVPPLVQAINPNPPASPVKLIFIHHSCGEYWLEDVGSSDYSGGLGVALRDNNYFVSDTNYGWGPDSIGDNTDIGHWWTWFRGPDSTTYLGALYTEYDQHSWYSRLDTDPGGENEIVMFKSCFPNSNLEGNPGDPPATDPNPLRGQDVWSGYHTVANAKGIYNDLLTYFATRQERLFIVITAPPVTDDTYAANARAFNTWLVNDWLDGYPHSNVAVFDFYNVLTHPNNHHRVYSESIQYVTSNGDGTLYYPGPDGSHPSAAGNQKARNEFVPLLNVYYNRWKSGVAPSLTLTAPTGSTIWPISSQQQIRWTTIGAISHVNLDYSTDGFATSHDIATSVVNTGCYTWTTPATPSTSVQVRVADAASPATIYATSAAFTLYVDHYYIYLPAVLRDYHTWDAYYEENDHWLDAYGPLVSGKAYLAYPDDTDDYYCFVLSAPATVTVSVADFAPTSTNGTVMLYGPAVENERGNLIDYYGPPGDSSMSLGPHSLGPGKYYIRVNTAKGHSTTQLYRLTVTY